MKDTVLIMLKNLKINNCCDSLINQSTEVVCCEKTYCMYVIEINACVMDKFNEFYYIEI